MFGIICELVNGRVNDGGRVGSTETSLRAVGARSFTQTALRNWPGRYFNPVLLERTLQDLSEIGELLNDLLKRSK
jgi:hypothetical protein